jgi:hypothetical protein
MLVAGCVTNIEFIAILQFQLTKPQDCISVSHPKALIFLYLLGIILMKMLIGYSIHESIMMENAGSNVAKKRHVVNQWFVRI